MYLYSLFFSSTVNTKSLHTYQECLDFPFRCTRPGRVSLSVYVLIFMLTVELFLLSILINHGITHFHIMKKIHNYDSTHRNVILKMLTANIVEMLCYLANIVEIPCHKLLRYVFIRCCSH